MTSLWIYSTLLSIRSSFFFFFLLPRDSAFFDELHAVHLSPEAHRSKFLLFNPLVGVRFFVSLRSQASREAKVARKVGLLVLRWAAAALLPGVRVHRLGDRRVEVGRRVAGVEGVASRGIGQLKFVQRRPEPLGLSTSVPAHHLRVSQPLPMANISPFSPAVLHEVSEQRLGEERSPCRKKSGGSAAKERESEESADNNVMSER